MTRRNLLLTMLTTALAPKVFAISASDSSALKNPGLSELFFKRFWKYHNENFFDHSRKWPAPLVNALMDQVGGLNEFHMQLPNERTIPRFQWVYHFEDEKLNSSLVEWFDLIRPERFRSSMRAYFPHLPNNNWCGLSWDVQQDIVTCHTLVQDVSGFNPKVSNDQFESFGFQSLVFVKKKFTAEEFTVFTKFVPDMQTYRNGVLQFRRTPVRKYNVLTGQKDAVELRRRLAREFRTSEATQALSPDGRRQRLYYI